MKDRPTVTIPDDHDVGQANLWGESGIVATSPAGNSGGYFYPIPYVNMVQRQQTWHLPDPVDPKKIKRDLEVYFTRLRVGGIDFAILEDRKFKTGPAGKIPKMGPRPDHINDPSYDRKAVDLDGLVLLGERQLKFLSEWSQDWEGAQMKAALSQTAFAEPYISMEAQAIAYLLTSTVMPGPKQEETRPLTNCEKHGPLIYAGTSTSRWWYNTELTVTGMGRLDFTSPAIVNTIYGRWWKPEDETWTPPYPRFTPTLDR